MKDETFLNIMFIESEDSDDILEALLEKQFKKYVGKFFSKIDPNERIEKEKEDRIIDRLNFILDHATTKTQLIFLTKIVNDKLFEARKQTRVKKHLVELLSLIEEKKYYDGTVQDYNFISYVIFKEKNLDYLKHIVSFNPALLRTMDENGNTLFYRILEKYLSLDVNLENEIYYFFQVLSFCFEKEKDQIMKDKMLYLSLIHHTSMKDEHIKKVLGFFESKQTVSKKDLYDKYNILLLDLEKEGNLIRNISNEGYHDFRNQEVFTIDSETDICLDDGFYLEKNPEGYTLYIHISDIPSLVPIGQKIDKQAYHQAETIYLKDQILRMFPSYISDNLASLLPYKETKVITYIIPVTSSFQMIEEKFQVVRGIICSKHKLSYQKADEIILGSEESTLKDQLLNMFFISQKLKQSNPSKEIYRQLENFINGYHHKNSHHESTITDISASANIVQEFMILINRMIAQYFHQRDLPFIYRTHQLYHKEQLTPYILEFNQKIKEYNQNIPVENYQKMITLMSRILLNARYSDVCLPHQGLNLDFYSHSTSPARRYADVVNEQLLYRFLFQEFTDQDVYLWENIVKEKVKYLNERHKQNVEFATEYHQLIRKR